MHSSKQVIILLGLLIERPAAVEKVALMPSIGKRDRKACLCERGKIYEVRKTREAEAATEAAIPDK